jgi:hypothetical protein
LHDDYSSAPVIGKFPIAITWRFLGCKIFLHSLLFFGGELPSRIASDAVRFQIPSFGQPRGLVLVFGDAPPLTGAALFCTGFGNHVRTIGTIRGEQRTHHRFVRLIASELPQQLIT